MNFYTLPDNYAQEIDSFELALKKFQKGEIHPTKFRAIRVPFGVYEQRTKGTFMLRIRTTAGGITPTQLKGAAQIAAKYCKAILHMTTRQELQFHDANLEDTPQLMRELYELGLSCRGGGGNSVRNIMASLDSGINPDEIFDVTPHAVSLSSRLIAEDDSWSFPRKFKISFSSCSTDNALAAFNDLGFIARQEHGKRGFRVYVAGGMGCRPRLSKVLHDFIEEERVYHVCRAVKNLYLEFGNRKTKNSGRLRFLWEELGEKKFREIYERELKSLAGQPPLLLNFEQFANTAPIRKIPGLQPREVNGDHFLSWKEQFVSKQAQEGLLSVLLPLSLGDIRAENAIKLANFLGHFGENVMRLTMTQNIQIRNLPKEYLGNLYELICEVESLSHNPRICSEIIGCTGANTCTTGVCLPQGVIPVMEKYLSTNTFSESKFAKIRINISGCPNSCGQHHVGDLGFYGRVARKNGRTLPGYWVTGGASIEPESRSYTKKCGWVAARDLPALLVDILYDYQAHGKGGEDFTSYFHREGSKKIETLCEHYVNKIPDFSDDERYYYDWSATQEFSTADMGHGECSAGIYDMIEVAMNSIKESLKEIEAPPKDFNTSQCSWGLVYDAASMLLVTRGVDPDGETETFDEFERHFLDSTLVAEQFRPLIDAARKKDFAYLGENIGAAAELGKTMIQLYHSMDNSLNFKCEIQQPVQAEQLASITAENEPALEDLRGVACPMNFVKTKVALAKIEGGSRIRIFLDDGEPIDNVPRSVMSEGHTIISQEKIDNHWQVVIEKKE